MKGSDIVFMTREELKEWIDCHIEYTSGADLLKNDCDRIVFMLEHCEISIPDHNRFFARVDCNGLAAHVMSKRRRLFDGLVAENGYGDGVDALAYTGHNDFSHTTAEWESVIGLGIYGLRARISEYTSTNSENEYSKYFYEHKR